MVLYLKQVVRTCAACPLERQKLINEDRIEEINLFSPVWGRFTAGLQAQHFLFWTITIFRRMQLTFQATSICDHAKTVPVVHLHTLYSQDSLTKRSWKQLFAMWKTTVLHCWTPRTASDAIHSRHHLMIWKHLVFKKKGSVVSMEIVFLIFSPYTSSTGRAASGWHCILEGSKIQDHMDHFQIIHQRAFCQVEKFQEWASLAKQQ